MTETTSETSASPESVILSQLNFDLPPFPATATQLVTLLNKPNVPVQSVVQLIECEPAIICKVLDLANSPLYGATRAITTIQHAIVLLGLKTVSQLALTVAAGDVFKARTDFGDIRERTYSQSLAIATTARAIAKANSIANADEAFLCGVVHDVGKVVLLNSVGDSYANLLSELPEDNTCEQEVTQFGATHAQLGMKCGQTWGMPEPINIAVGNHHLSADSIDDGLSKTIIHAVRLTREWGIGFDRLERDADMEVASEWEFSDETRDACIEQFEAIRNICMS